MSRLFTLALTLCVLLGPSQELYGQDEAPKSPTVEALKTLRSGSAKARRRALQELAKSRIISPEIWKAIEAAQGDACEEVRVEVVVTLRALIKHPEAQSLLVQCVKDQSVAVRGELSRSLAGLPESESKDRAFLTLLKDSRSLVVTRVLYDARHRKTLTPAMIERILELTGHPHPQARAFIPVLLEKIQADQFQSLFQSFDKRSQRCQEYLRAALFQSKVSSPWVYEHIVGLLKKKRYKKAVLKRLHGAKALVLPALLKEYQRAKNEDYRGELEDVFETIFEKIADDDFHKDMIDPLVFVMLHGNEDLAYAASEALATDSDLAPTILNRALTAIDKLKKVPDCEEVLERFDNLITEKCTTVLLSWARREKTVSALFAGCILIESDDPWRPTKTQINWGAQSKQSSVQYLTLKLIDSQAEFGEYFALKVLLRFLKHRDHEMRKDAARKLGRLARPFPPAARALKEIALGENEDLAELGLRYAPNALSQDAAFMERLFQHLKKLDAPLRDVAVERLTRFRGIPKRWTQTLITLARSRDVGVRCAAIGALGRQSEPSEAVRLAVLNALLGEDESVRSSASKASWRLTLSKDEVKRLVDAARKFAKNDESDRVKDVLAALVKTSSAEDLVVDLFEDLVEDKRYHDAIDTAISGKPRNKAQDLKWVRVLGELLKMSYLRGRVSFTLQQMGPMALPTLSDVYDSCQDGGKALILAVIAQHSWTNKQSVGLIEKGFKESAFVKSMAWSALKRHYKNIEDPSDLLMLAFAKAYPDRPEMIRALKPTQIALFNWLLKRYQACREGHNKTRLLQSLSYCQVDRSPLAKTLLSKLSGNIGPDTLRVFEQVQAPIIKDLQTLALDSSSDRQRGALKVLTHILRRRQGPREGQLFDSMIPRFLALLKKKESKGRRLEIMILLSQLKGSRLFDEDVYHATLKGLKPAEVWTVLSRQRSKNWTHEEEELFCELTESGTITDAFEQFCHAHAGATTISERARQTFQSFMSHKSTKLRLLAFDTYFRAIQRGPQRELELDRLFQALLEEDSADFLQLFQDLSDQMMWISSQSFSRLIEKPHHLERVDVEGLSYAVRDNLDLTDKSLQRHFQSPLPRLRLLAGLCLYERQQSFEDHREILSAMLQSDDFRDRLWAAKFARYGGRSISKLRPALIGLLRDCQQYNEADILMSLLADRPLNESEWRRLPKAQQKRLRKTQTLLSMPELLSFESLRPLLGHEDPGVQLGAIYRLTETGLRRRSVVLALLAQAPKAQGPVQVWIARALKKEKEPREALIKVFRGFLKTGGPLVQEVALQKLLSLGVEEIPTEAFARVLDAKRLRRIPLFSSALSSKEQLSVVLPRLRDKLQIHGHYEPGAGLADLLTVSKEVEKELQWILNHVDVDPRYATSKLSVSDAAVQKLMELILSKSLSAWRRHKAARLLRRVKAECITPRVTSLIPVFFGADSGLAEIVSSILREQFKNEELCLALVKSWPSLGRSQRISLIDLLLQIAPGTKGLNPSILALDTEKDSELDRRKLILLGALGYEGKHGAEALLGHASALHRRDAEGVLHALALRARNNEKAESFLLKTLKSKNPKQRRMALKALQRKKLTKKLSAALVDLIPRLSEADFHWLLETLDAKHACPEAALLELYKSGSKRSQRRVLRLLTARSSLSPEAQAFFLKALKKAKGTEGRALLALFHSLKSVSEATSEALLDWSMNERGELRRALLPVLCRPAYSRHSRVLERCFQGIKTMDGFRRDEFIYKLAEAATLDAIVFEKLILHENALADLVFVQGRTEFAKKTHRKALAKALNYPALKIKRRALRVLLGLGPKAPKSLKAAVESLRESATEKGLRTLCEDVLFLLEQ